MSDEKRLCPVCGTELKRIINRLSLRGASSGIAFYMDQDAIAALYCCPACGKMELYQFDLDMEREESAAADNAVPTSQPAEPTASAEDPWEDKPSGLFRRKKKDKPDWEK